MSRRLRRLENPRGAEQAPPEAPPGERIREEIQTLDRRSREDPVAGAAYADALTRYLDADAQARARGEDPEKDPEVLAATRDAERARWRLLNEETDDEGRRN